MENPKWISASFFFYSIYEAMIVINSRVVNYDICAEIPR